jgi:hypothetical protein
MKVPERLAKDSRELASFFRKPLFTYENNGNSLSEQVENHFRFSLEFLVRSGIINLHAEPIHLAGIATHLYFTEPSNFVICNILSSPALFEITEKAEKDWVGTARCVHRPHS